MTERKKKDTNTPTLQMQMDELLVVVEKLEDPDVSLEDSLALYEKGMELVAAASRSLEDAEQRVALVTASGEVQALEQ